MSVAANAWGGTTTPDLETEDLKYFCAVIEARSGIFLKPAKHDLVRTRLRSRITAHGFSSYKEYSQYLSKISKDDPEWEIFTNSLTTNKTDFFREPKHFEYLVQTILPLWLKTDQKTFLVWSAASSTGEEVYTLAMVLDRHLPADRDFKIIGTDIDTDVLSAAKNAVYPIAKKSEIPADYQTSCLDLGQNEARGWFRIKPHIKTKVTLKQHNLIGQASLENNFFDLVLCRNVLIYFAADSIEFVQNKLFKSTKPDGHLFIGHSESFQGIKHNWKSVGPSVFKKVSSTC